MASRRKRGPVAFRPRLLAGLALLLYLLTIVEDRQNALIVPYPEPFRVMVMNTVTRLNPARSV